MKNIYIIGSPRTGKSTLARLIKEKYPEYNQVSFEAIRNGFITSLPELHMEKRNSESRKKILPLFIFEYLKWNSIITNSPFIIEGTFCTLEEIIKNKTENDLIICLGHGNTSLNDIIENIQKYSKPDDYTYSWDKEKIKNHFYNICDEDKLYYDECKKYNIEYNNTLINREEVLNKILNDLK